MPKRRQNVTRKSYEELLNDYTKRHIKYTEGRVRQKWPAVRKWHRPRRLAGIWDRIRTRIYQSFRAAV